MDGSIDRSIEPADGSTSDRQGPTYAYPPKHTKHQPGGTALFRSDTAFENNPVAGQEPAERPSKELLEEGAVKVRGEEEWAEDGDGEVCGWLGVGFGSHSVVVTADPSIHLSIYLNPILPCPPPNHNRPTPGASGAPSSTASP